MIKEQKALAQKLKHMTLNVAAQPDLKKPIEESKEKLIILTTEDTYKIESVLIYSLPVGQEYKLTYNKKDISQELVDSVELMKTHIGYMYFKKNETEYIPIKEMILTGIEENEDSLILTLLVGPVEPAEERRAHAFIKPEKGVEKLIFLAQMK